MRSKSKVSACFNRRQSLSPKEPERANLVAGNFFLVNKSGWSVAARRQCIKRLGPPLCNLYLSQKYCLFENIVIIMTKTSLNQKTLQPLSIQQPQSTTESWSLLLRAVIDHHTVHRIERQESNCSLAQALLSLYDLGGMTS